MGTNYNPKIVTNGLILSLDAANVNKSFPGPLGPELVTDTRLTQIDGITGNVFRDAVTSVPLTICPVTSGKTYYVEYYMSSFPGYQHATFRVGNSTGNMTSISPLGTAAYIGAGAVGIMRAYIFTALTTNNLSIYGDNTGTDLNMDYVSVKEILSGAGTAFNDLSGNGNTGTLIGNPVYSRSNNGIFTFDGINNYAKLNNNQVADNLTSMSVSIWVYCDWTNATNYATIPIINKCADASNSAGWDLGRGFLGNDVYFFLQNAGGSAFLIKRVAVTPGTYWLNIVVTYSGGPSNSSTISMYINGANQTLLDAGSTGTFSTITTTSAITLGSRDGANTYGARYFTGNIGNATIYNRVLSSTEVLQNFNALRGRYGI